MTTRRREVRERLPLISCSAPQRRAGCTASFFEGDHHGELSTVMPLPQTLSVADVWIACTHIDGDPVAVFARWNHRNLVARQAWQPDPVLTRSQLGTDCVDLPSPFAALAFLALGDRDSALRVGGRLAPLGVVTWMSMNPRLSVLEAADFDWRGIAVLGSDTPTVRGVDKVAQNLVRPYPQRHRTPGDGGPAAVQVALRHEQFFDLAIRFETVAKTSGCLSEAKPG